MNLDAPCPDPGARSDPISVELETVLPFSRDDYWRLQKRIKIEQIMTGTPHIAAVKETRELVAPFKAPGGRRLVTLADGSQALEQTLTIDDDGFSYVVWGFSSPARFLIAFGYGRWWLTRTSDDQTRARWRYSFYPRSFLTRLFVRRFAETRWRPNMEQALENIRRIKTAWRAEEAAASEADAGQDG